tara:strand:+ start:420 stop:722 length:303 start_codon:yes stop_codon:yes gene_type:complete
MKNINSVILNDQYKDVDAPCIIKADSDFNSLIGKEISILADLISLASQDDDLLAELREKSNIPSKELFHRLSDIFEKISKSNSNEFFYDKDYGFPVKVEY